MADYSFSPQFATIRSESPLAGMRPVAPQHTPLSFAEQRVLQVKSAQPELVSQAISSGLQEGIGGALKGITAAFVGERERKDKLAEEGRKATLEKELANIRAYKTSEEKEYESLRLDNLRKTIEEKGGTKKPLNLAPRNIFRSSPTVVEPDGLPAWEVGGEVVPKNVPQPQTKPLSSIPNPPKNSFATKIPADIFETTTPIVVTDRQKPAFATTIPEDIFEEPKKSTYAGWALTPEDRQLQKPPEQLAKEQTLVVPDQAYVPPEMSVLLASAGGGGISDVGGRDVLSQQTQASAMTPATPQVVTTTPGAVPATPQAMADYATQIPVRKAIPVTPQYSASELLNMTYQSWEDAEMANLMIAQQYPDYNIKPIERFEYDGNTYYSLQPPERKETAKTGVPEGLKIKSGKMDETGKVVYDLEPELPKEKQLLALKQPIQTNEIMLRTIQQIKSIYKGLSPATGFTGSIMQYIQGSDAADVRKLIKTLQGNIAFKALADMRAASPTGGALGSVSNIELELLASTMGSIDPNMSEFLFTENLNTIEKILTDFNSAAKQKMQQIENPQKFQSIQPQEDRVEIKSQEDYSKLKSGQKYIFNGVTGTKK
jgi:hypothetical protein